MKMRSFRSAAAAAFVLLASAAPAFAHHSYAMFDRSKQIKLEGTARLFEWTNPHIFIELTVAGPGGAPVNYSIEGTSPGVLRRQGWKYNSIQTGDKLEVMMSPLKDGVTLGEGGASGAAGGAVPK